MLTSQIYGKQAFKAKKTRKGEIEHKKIGKIHLVVFSPDGKTVLGYLVKRPDLALMIKREDVFVAFDSLAPYEKGYVITGEAATDDAARKRLDVDWDHCLLWNGMDAKTTKGKVLGFVGNISYDAATGRVEAFHIGDGNVASSLVGAIKIPVEMYVGYKDGCLLLKPEAADVQPSGGLAAKAGESYARAKMNASEAGHKAAAKAGEAVQEGSYNLGKTIGKAKKTATKKAKEATGSVDGKSVAKAAGQHMSKVGGMFKAFKDEFDEASK